MHIRHFAVAALLLFSGTAGAQLTTGTTSVVLYDKTVVRVESGTLQVPESRARPSMPRRKSAGSMATRIFIWGVIWSITGRSRSCVRGRC